MKPFIVAESKLKYVNHIFRLWLNEGFASYMEYLGASHVEPNTGLQDRFALESMHNTFKQGE